MKRILISTFILAWVAAFMVAGTSLAQDKFPSKPINVMRSIFSRRLHGPAGPRR